ncbi:thiamine-phosphate kinase [Novosphingobium mangrovi (ex Hu et al. 2023)]|uniref:Thiamine-monophosphate kinase n=1 Tax=Novosphingobium mangrovi (ex Hu et al. 2023) TaxID=2930094 RepID=A0ABT0A9Y9_9SPHN|nr:thiamine-phosphate kinase [Novosphingobium mangrovi (ex Hu et al. 2023)]MCJ1960023.1 thiamine-phosphate kinase [Novosphingobium mangrovi (ex Hu et al. 2023)]
MSSETAFISALRNLASSTAARGLMDDAAVLNVGGADLVLTMDTVVESVHFLPDDPAQDVAWKLVAVNASDLSAKGASPLGCLYSHALGEDAWDTAFLEGLAEACRHFALPLLGGDTVRMPESAPRSFSLTALGQGPKGTEPPARTMARVGDIVWVSGTIGDSGLGLDILLGKRTATGPEADWLKARYRRPMPLTPLGPALAPYVHAMMDVSDGLLVDLSRLAAASHVGARIELEAVPLSSAYAAIAGTTREARMKAACAGDDYVLLFTAPPENTADIEAITKATGGAVHALGAIQAEAVLRLTCEGTDIPLPAHLGYEH